MRSARGALHSSPGDNDTASGATRAMVAKYHARSPIKTYIEPPLLLFPPQYLIVYNRQPSLHQVTA